MSRYRWIYEGGEVIARYENDVLVWSKKEILENKGESAYIMPDIEPYKSMVDGSMITSRSKHREHLKEHGVIEIGNETKYLKQKPVAPPPGLKEKVARQVYEKLSYGKRK